MVIGLTVQQSENRQFKVFTAMAIVLIVVGHINSTGFNGPFDLVKPYSFHVAAFAFSSGYFFRLQSAENLLPWLLKKVRQLVVPMYLLYLIYGLVTILLNNAGFSAGSGLSYYSLLVSPWTDGHQFKACLPMWFIAPFFLSQLLFAGVHLGISSSRASAFAADLVELFICASTGAFAIWMGGKDGLDAGPLLLLCRSFFLLMWLSAGKFYRTYIEQHDTAGNTCYFLVCLTMELFMFTLLRGTNIYIPSWCRFPHGIVLTILSTAVGIAFILRISRVLEPLLPDQGGIARKLANNSFSIMCHHYFGFFLMKAVFAFISVHTGLFGNFDMNSFLESAEYFYYPRGLIQFAFVYVVVGITFSLVVHEVWVWLKERLHVFCGCSTQHP